MLFHAAPLAGAPLMSRLCPKRRQFRRPNVTYCRPIPSIAFSGRRMLIESYWALCPRRNEVSSHAFSSWGSGGRSSSWTWKRSGAMLFSIYIHTYVYTKSSSGRPIQHDSLQGISHQEKIANITPAVMCAEWSTISLSACLPSLGDQGSQFKAGTCASTARYVAATQLIVHPS
ncbi:hypothetical protein BZA05DRAFT_25113 [Tricharina praecox]|uniref:uncharacterized protein n=1 Tax=Tricharina praecox TaxID=43433 RepID=UPI00221FA869|nr:uncharacterized protein BZA05DRAFT_25113 [Tricharina praecox]KAI5853307.1 hypothetical protein BZA05DRAFT_25113 [Tricharina praecox]